MTVHIRRSNGSAESSYTQTYSVPFAVGSHTVMDALDYIAQNVDTTLAYYRHSSCNQGICGRCGVKVNGKTVLACAHIIEEDDILLEPRAGIIVRDLIAISKQEAKQRAME